MKILIAGGCGFIGSNLAIFLKKKLKNSNISSLDNFFRRGSRINLKNLKKFNIKNYNIDIKNYKKIKKLPRFNLIIDCCAEPAIEVSKQDPDRVINTNLIGTYNLLKKATVDKSKIIFLSTSRVYSIKKLNSFKKKIKKEKFSYLIDENFPTTAPISLYGMTKLSSENLIKEFSYSNNIKYIINRFGVIAGPWQFGKIDQGFVSLWVGRHLNKKKLSYIGYNGSGNQIRDVLHVNDLCEIIMKQIINFSKIYNQTFNIGGGINNAISLKKLTYLCKKLTKNTIRIGKKPKTSIFDIPYYVSNNAKIKKFYSWEPKFNLKNILEDIYYWLKKNKLILKVFF